MENDNDTQSNGSTRTDDYSRRAFLRRTSAAAVGVGIFGGWAKQATAAAVLPPIISTRGYYNYYAGSYGAPGHAVLNDEYTPTDYDGGWGAPGIDGPCDEVAIIVHGWDNDEDDARRKFGTAVMELAPHYSGRFVGYSWDADAGPPTSWLGPKKVAEKNGTHLAQFIVDLRKACMSSRIHLLGHSLGALVVLRALEALNRRDDWLSWYKLHSVCLFGAAVDNETPATAPYDTAIHGEAGRMYNFYSTDDLVLSSTYWAIELDQALGEDGIESGRTPPANYTDIDVTASVGTNHSGYLTSIPELMAEKMQWE